jgi:tetratricopeptide (TPR) repeat protein
MERHKKILLGALAVVVIVAVASVVVSKATPKADMSKVTASVTPKPAPEPNLSVALQQANSAAVAKNYVSAEQILTTFLASAHIADDKYHANVALAQVYDQAGDEVKAISTFKAAQKVSGKVQFVDSYGTGNAALKQFTSAVSKQGYDVKTVVGYRTEAEAAYNAALALAPNAATKQQINAQLNYLRSTEARIK